MVHQGPANELRGATTLNMFFRERPSSGNGSPRHGVMDVRAKMLVFPNFKSLTEVSHAPTALEVLHMI